MSEERKEKLTREQLMKIMEDTLMLYKYLDQKGKERDNVLELVNPLLKKGPPEPPKKKIYAAPAKPSYPKKPKLGCLGKTATIIGCLIMIEAIPCLISSEATLTAIILLIFGFLIGFALPYLYKKFKQNRACQLIDLDYKDELDRYREKNIEAEEEYQAALAQYEVRMKEWEANRESRLKLIDDYHNKFTEIESEMREVEEKISICYQTSGIPTTYCKRWIFNRLYGYFYNNRVDTIREAINLYETESQNEERQRKLEDSLAMEIEQLKEQLADGQRQSHAIQRQLVQAQENAAALTSDQMNAIKEKLNQLNSSAAILEYYAANSSNK